MWEGKYAELQDRREVAQESDGENDEWAMLQGPACKRARLGDELEQYLALPTVPHNGKAPWTLDDLLKWWKVGGRGKPRELHSNSRSLSPR